MKIDLLLQNKYFFLSKNINEMQNKFYQDFGKIFLHDISISTFCACFAILFITIILHSDHFYGLVKYPAFISCVLLPTLH